jgi:hypothetical protein
MQKNIYLCDMEKEFVIYSLALRMKKLGYNGSCFAFYQVENFEEKPCGVDDRDEYIRTGFATCKNSEIPEHFTSAPTFSQAFRWFRENYNLFCEINVYKTIEPKFVFTIKEYESAQFLEGFGEDVLSEYLYYKHEEAEVACLEKLIEIVEQKEK